MEGSALWKGYSVKVRTLWKGMYCKGECIMKRECIMEVIPNEVDKIEIIMEGSTLLK